MTITNITDLIETLKFGYEGDINDLIYLLMFIAIVIYPFIKWFINLLRKKVFKNDRCN